MSASREGLLARLEAMDEAELARLLPAVEAAAEVIEGDAAEAAPSAPAEPPPHAVEQLAEQQGTIKSPGKVK